MKEEIQIDDKNSIEVLLFEDGGSFFVEVIEWTKISDRKRSGKRKFCDKFVTKESAIEHYQNTLTAWG